MTFVEALRGCAGDLSDMQVGQLAAHYDLLERWNKVLNLTSIRKLDEIVIRHYCESLFLARRVALAPDETVVDVGSGAGFPGVPVAVLHPGNSVTLVESHTRKSVFLREATRGIGNVQVLNSRVEQVRQRFDVLISRAVAWSDFGRVAAGICGRIALLAGERDAEGILQDKAFDWGPVVMVPGGDKRVLLTGVVAD